MKLSWVDATKWATGAAMVGGLLGVILSDSQVDQVADWATIGQTIAVALAGALSAFLVAIRKKG